MLTNLYTEVITQALDDICPADEKQVKERLDKYRGIEEAYDKEWELLQSQYEKEQKEFLESRTRIQEKISQQDNASTVDRKIAKKRGTKDRKVARLRRQRAQRLKSLNPFDYWATYQREHDEITEEFDETITHCEQKFCEDKNRLNSSRNSVKIKSRREVSDKVWTKNRDLLEKRFKIKEANYNLRRNEEDHIRVAIEWFVNDFEYVLDLCRKVELDVKDCYQTARERIELIGYDTKPVDDILEKIENHEY